MLYVKLLDPVLNHALLSIESICRFTYQFSLDKHKDSLSPVYFAVYLKYAIESKYAVLSLENLVKSGTI